jgi:membrane protease YdiL (CAAX protease family)
MMNTESGIIKDIEDKKPEKRVWGAWATTGFGAVVMGVFIIVQVLVVIIAGFVMTLMRIQPASGTPQVNDITQQITDLLNANLGLLQSIATITSGIIGLGVILLFIKARKRAGIKEYLGLNKISLKTVLVVSGVVVGLIVVTDVISRYLLRSSTGGGIVSDIYGTSGWPPLFWIAVVIFAPLFEEAFFRGFLFEGFRQSSLGAPGAIFLTALGWALIHSLQYNIYSILWIFVLGIAMGIVRVRTKSIWSTFIMHALVNIIATAEVALKLSIFIR